MVFQTWNRMEKKEKGKQILLLAYIADVSCLTNRFFDMRNIVFKFCIGCGWNHSVLKNLFSIGMQILKTAQIERN